MKLYSQGATEEVTGSKHFLETDKSKIQIDCGAFQGRRAEADKKNRDWQFEPKGLDAVLLTHAHYDHCGLMPLLPKRGYKGNIYSTSATRDIANLIMMDSAKIQFRDAEFLKKRAKKRGEKFEWEPLYKEKDVIDAMQLFVTTSYQRPMLITPDVTASFYDAGHILGSSLIYLDVKNDDGTSVKIGYSGDLGRSNKPILKDPSKIPDVDYLVLEGTYGDRTHEASEDILPKLEKIINDAVSRGGKIIIPAFAVERTQDIVYSIHMLLDQKRIPEIPMYVDSPMATNATGIFKMHPECYDKETYEVFTNHHKNPFGFNALRYITNSNESKELNKMEGSAIIIASSGMCEAGRIQHHLLHNVSDPNCTILIVGYMAAYTLGRRIKEKQEYVKIFGNRCRLNAQVKEVKAFSGHADYKEIWNYVSALDLNKLKKVFLVHGEVDSLAFMKKMLLGKGVKEVQIVKAGEKYEI